MFESGYTIITIRSQIPNPRIPDPGSRTPDPESHAPAGEVEAREAERGQLIERARQSVGHGASRTPHMKSNCNDPFNTAGIGAPVGL